LRSLELHLTLFLAIAVARGATAETMELRYGQAFSAAESVYSLPTLIADREGFFTREGLSFRNVLVPGGGDKMIAALDDGTVDVTHVATAFLISRNLAGSDAVAIAAEFDNPIYSLVAKPEISSFADLKGRVIGLADEAGTVAYATKQLLAANGIGAEDFKTRIISGTPARVECLKRGACDAVPLGQPQDFVAMKAGYRLLGRSDEAVPAFLYTVTAARRSWAAAHSDVVIRYVRALDAAFRFIRDPARRDAVMRMLAEAAGSSEEAARATLALYLDRDRHVLPRRGEIELGGLQPVIAFMAEAGLVQAPLPAAERFVDLRYLQAAGIQ
jgi:ABC-type nitrate/sulfonate/bicarbonate transport system substrate-binding protein